MLIYTDWSVYIRLIMAVLKIFHNNTRTNILTAALDLFAKFGYNAICKAAFLLRDWKNAYRRFTDYRLNKNNLHFEQITR